MSMDATVFLHNYGQLASMLRGYLGALAAVNQMSLHFLDENELVLVEIVNSSYYTYTAMQSLVKALSAAGDETAKESIIASKEFTDKVEKSWSIIKNRLSSNVPDLNHPLLSLDFIVGKDVTSGND